MDAAHGVQYYVVNITQYFLSRVFNSKLKQDLSHIIHLYKIFDILHRLTFLYLKQHTLILKSDYDTILSPKLLKNIAHRTDIVFELNTKGAIYTLISQEATEKSGNFIHVIDHGGLRCFSFSMSSFGMKLLMQTL